jgi:CelD/BcsL family acetyltransferase involved in cellulose biosynthesis
MNITLQAEFPGPSLAPEWNNLLAESITNSPFLRFEYLAQWWQTRGGGEWPNAKLALITAREDDRLIGVAPLFHAANRDGEPALLLLGSIEVSDQLDLIVRPGDLTRFARELLRYLAQDYPAPFVALDWYNLPDTSPTLAAVKAAAAGGGWSYHEEVYLPAPFIPLVADYEAYLGTLDKKQRHEIRRKVRRAEESPDGTRWYIVDDGARLEAEMDSFLALMAMDQSKSDFLTPRMKEQMKATARAAFHEGWLQLAFLEADGEKACGYLNFDYAGRIWVYNSGLDPRFMDLSPGWVLLAYLVQWASEHGRSEFDFLRGGEDYKYKFGGRDRFVMRMTARRP